MYFSSDSTKKLETEPILDNPPTISQMVELAEYLRATNNVDRDNGYNACRAVNRGMITYLRNNQPETESYILVCESFSNIKRLQSSAGAVEHFVAVVKAEEGYTWIDGTADQIVGQNNRIITQTVESLNDVIPSVADSIGGDWKFDRV